MLYTILCRLCTSDVTRTFIRLETCTLLSPRSLRYFSHFFMSKEEALNNSSRPQAIYNYNLVLRSHK
jgi:hypothetical protein